MQLLTAHILAKTALECWALDVETRTENVDFFKLCPKQDMASLDQTVLCV